MTDPATAAAIEFALEHADTILGHLSKAKGPIDKLTARTLKPGLAEYLVQTTERFRRIKTLINHSDPVDFSTIYVNQTISLASNPGANVIPDNDILTAKVAQHIILSGTAGTGKSMLMRHLLLSALGRQDRPLPVFVELRKINEITSFALQDFLLSTIRTQAEDFPSEAFLKLLEDGRVIFLLDGYDELLHEKRAVVAKQISNFVRKFPECKTIISSRPYEQLDYLEGFKNYVVNTMTIAQSLEVIDKLKYDQSVKTKFSAAVKKTLHKSHASFVANPLLLSMMLLTFEQYASIPRHMHIFYNQAFETLFMKHDVSKDMWTRKSYTGLQIDQFRRILSNFSAITYLREQFSFTLTDLISELRRSIKIEEEKTSPEDFLKDLEESICMLQKDGLNYTFTHRSFQEYFCAVFLEQNTEYDLGKALELTSGRQDYDGVLPMLLSMATDRVEREWVLPTIKSALRTLGPGVARVTALELLSLFFDEVRIRKARGRAKGIPKYRIYADYASPSLWAVRRLYNKELITIAPGRRRSSDKVIIDLDQTGSKLLFEKAPNLVTRDGEEDEMHIVFAQVAEADKANLNNLLETTGICTFCRETHIGLIRLEKIIARRLARKAERLTDVLSIKRRPPPSAPEDMS